MKNQLILDELGKLSQKSRLKKIAKKKEYILGEDFISFLKGQLEFAEAIRNNPSYFERIYMGENSEFLKFMKSEMEQQASMAREVWQSIENFVEQHDMNVLLKTGLASIFGDKAHDSFEDHLPCGKCNELIKSHGLCTGCLSGDLPKQVKETLQNKSDADSNSNLVGNKEILSEYNKNLD